VIDRRIDRLIFKSAEEGQTMNPKIEAYNQKVRTELDQAKSKLEELEARSEAEDEEAVTDLINQLKSTHHSIEQKRLEINRSAVEEMEQEQAEIDAGIARLKEGLAELDRRLSPEQGRKAA
jgi:hypothetical protein